MKFGRAIKYAILIEPTDNQGFIVKVGCGNFSFKNKFDLKDAINEFLDDPDGFEKLFNKENCECEVTEGVREVGSERSGWNMGAPSQVTESIK